MLVFSITFGTDENELKIYSLIQKNVKNSGKTFLLLAIITTAFALPSTYIFFTHWEK